MIAGPFGVTLLVTAAGLLAMQAVAVALRVGRHSVVDTAWGIGIARSRSSAPPSGWAASASSPSATGSRPG
jgi:hypothetical protein